MRAQSGQACRVGFTTAGTAQHSSLRPVANPRLAGPRRIARCHVERQTSDNYICTNVDGERRAEIRLRESDGDEAKSLRRVAPPRPIGRRLTIG